MVAAVAQRIHRDHQGVDVSAAVFRHWPRDRDGIGQDWKLWCDQGYLDFVCPMDYTPDSREFDVLVPRQQQWAGSVPCFPGIGLSTWQDPADMVTLIRQILITRRHQTGGFTIFQYDFAAANEVLPACGRGITRRE